MRIWCAKQLDSAFRYALEEAAAVIIQEARVIGDTILSGEPLTMRVSKRAKWVMDLTSEEAGAQKKREINTGHLLLGILREGGTAAQILQNNGVTLEAARDVVKRSGSEHSTEDESMINPTPTSANMHHATEDASIGDLGTVRPATGRDTVEMARTSEAFLRMSEAFLRMPDVFLRMPDVFLARDGQGDREMLSSAEGYATPLVVLTPASTPIKLPVTPRDTDTQTARLAMYVRVLTGDYARQTGFLRRESFRRTGTDDAPFPPPLGNADWITQGSDPRL